MHLACILQLIICVHDIVNNNYVLNVPNNNNINNYNFRIGFKNQIKTKPTIRLHVDCEYSSNILVNFNF